MGLLIGCVLNQDYNGQAKQFKPGGGGLKGLMVLIAGANVIRFAPSLIISQAEVKEGLARFEIACRAVIEGAAK